MDVIAETCHKPIITFNATIAAIVRSIDQDDPPTLLVDEADALFGSKKSAEQNEDLRGLLNSGHQRNRPLLRWDMTSRSLDELPTFSMAMLASIGDLPATVMDRAIVIRMRRRAVGEKIEPWRSRRDAPPLNKLRGQLGKWVRGHLRQLRTAAPDMPLEDRAADTWEPLVAVAELAGEAWPVRARTAAEALTRDEADAEADASASIRLLEDAYAVFEDAAALHSKTLVDRLTAMDESPWADWARGRGLNQPGLAKLLRPFGIKPCNVREHGTDPPKKGYRVEQFDDAWARYAPHLRASAATAATAVTSQLSGQMPAATPPLHAVTDPSDVAGRSGSVAAAIPALTSDVTAVAAVADTPSLAKMASNGPTPTTPPGNVASFPAWTTQGGSPDDNLAGRHFGDTSRAQQADSLHGTRYALYMSDLSGSSPTLHLTAVVTQEGDWYVARCLEIEAVSQGETLDQALANLRDVVEVYLQEEGLPPAPTHPLVTSIDVPIPA